MSVHSQVNAPQKRQAQIKVRFCWIPFEQSNRTGTPYCERRQRAQKVSCGVHGIVHTVDSRSKGYKGCVLRRVADVCGNTVVLQSIVDRPSVSRISKVGSEVGHADTNEDCRGGKYASGILLAMKWPIPAHRCT